MWPLICFVPLALVAFAQTSFVNASRHDEGHRDSIESRDISGHNAGWFQPRFLDEGPTIDNIVANTRRDLNEYASYMISKRTARKRSAPKHPTTKKPIPKRPPPRNSAAMSPASKGGAQTPIALYDPKNDPRAKARKENKNK